MHLSEFFEIIRPYRQLIDVGSVVLSIIGFAILIGEVGSAQKTEIHVLTRDIIKGFREAREDVKSFVAAVREELRKAMNDGVAGHLLANRLLAVYFSDSARHESFARLLLEDGLSDSYIQSLGFWRMRRLPFHPEGDSNQCHAWRAIRHQIDQRRTFDF